MKMVCNLDANLVGYLGLSFIMIDVGKLYINLGGYFELYCIMVDLGNLDAN
jgi:hypothetical protein